MSFALQRGHVLEGATAEGGRGKTGGSGASAMLRKGCGERDGDDDGMGTVTDAPHAHGTILPGNMPLTSTSAEHREHRSFTPRR